MSKTDQEPRPARPSPARRRSNPRPCKPYLPPRAARHLPSPSRFLLHAPLSSFPPPSDPLVLHRVAVDAGIPACPFLHVESHVSVESHGVLVWIFGSSVWRKTAKKLEPAIDRTFNCNWSNFRLQLIELSPATDPTFTYKNWPYTPPATDHTFSLPATDHTFSSNRSIWLHATLMNPVTWTSKLLPATGHHFARNWTPFWPATDHNLMSATTNYLVNIMTLLLVSWNMKMTQILVLWNMNMNMAHLLVSWKHEHAWKH